MPATRSIARSTTGSTAAGLEKPGGSAHPFAVAVSAPAVRRSRRKRRVAMYKLPAIDLRRRYTYDEVSELLEEDHGPYELWDGELIMSPTPDFQHQRIVGFVYRQLFEFVISRELGDVVIAPFDMVLAPRRSFQPDVLFLSTAKRHLIKRVLHGPADLVVEVTSPHHRRRDRIEKRDLYAQHGIAEYWLIDPEAQTVEVLALVRGEYQLHGRYAPGEQARSVLLPEFTLDVAAALRG
jgi:Uma2 family endonuclease